MKFFPRFLILAVVLVGALRAAGAESPEKPPHGPVAAFPELSKDLGDIMLTYVVSHTYAVRNEGDEDLTMSVQPDCGCTVADFSERIPPGGEGYVKLTVEGTRGFKSVNAEVTTNEPEGRNRHRLIISAMFMEHVEFVPGRQVLFEGDPPPLVQELTLRNHDIERPLSIVKAEVSSNLRPYVSLRVEPAVTGKEYRLFFERTGDFPKGLRLRGTATVAAAHPRLEAMTYIVEIRLFQPGDSDAKSYELQNRSRPKNRVPR